ncbi:MAG: ribonuclease P protein component [Muribaculaceae bacterium]|nr:ribonuclease P protein component [Muribaculaceae bacterium]
MNNNPILENFKLYKSEKLCSKIEIEKLYAQGTSVIAYPLRAVWLAVPCSEQNNSKRTMARFLISIPKKRVHHAVDRVLLRRRAREAYRLNRNLLYPVAQEHGVTVLIGFNWIANHHYSYSTIERSMQELLRKISTAIAGEKSAIEK